MTQAVVVVIWWSFTISCWTFAQFCQRFDLLLIELLSLMANHMYRPYVLRRRLNTRKFKGNKHMRRLKCKQCCSKKHLTHFLQTICNMALVPLEPLKYTYVYCYCYNMTLLFISHCCLHDGSLCDSQLIKGFRLQVHIGRVF